MNYYIIQNTGKMEKILFFTLLVILTLNYHKYHHYNYNVHKQIIINDTDNFTKNIKNDNHQFDYYQNINLPINLLPEYKYSLPMIYFMFIVEQ